MLTKSLAESECGVFLLVDYASIMYLLMMHYYELIDKFSPMRNVCMYVCMYSRSGAKWDVNEGTNDFCRLNINVRNRHMFYLNVIQCNLLH